MQCKRHSYVSCLPLFTAKLWFTLLIFTLSAFNASCNSKLKGSGKTNQDATDSSESGGAESDTDGNDTSENGGIEGEAKDPLDAPKINNITEPQSLPPAKAIEPLIFTSTNAKIVSCTVAPPLPPGLETKVVDGVCRISGEAKTLHPKTVHTVTVVSASGATDTASVTIQVERATTSPALVSSEPQTYTASLAVPSLTLTNLGLNAVSCTVDPTLPSGLSVETHDGSCRITGTPTASSSGTYAITATAADNSTGSANVVITVVAAQPPVIEDAGSKNFETGMPVSAFDFTNSGSPVRANGCTITPTLPAGLNVTVQAGTCRIYGTPANLQEAADYTVTATASDGTTDTALISIKISDTNPPVITNHAVVISGLTKNSATLTWTKATDLGTLQSLLQYRICYHTSAIDEECNGATITQDFTPNISSFSLNGLSSKSLYHYRVLVKDTSDQVSSYTSGTVETLGDAPELSNAGAQSFAVGQAITDYDFQNDGAAIITCSITPAMPLGLTLTQHGISCRLSGTPTALQTATSYTLTATSADSSTDTATFSIAVVDDVAPQISSPALTASDVEKTNFELSWASASDNHTAQNDLRYKVCYGTAAISDALCSGATVLHDFVAAITEASLTGLSSNTTYHYRVFVRDASNNVSSYTAGSQITAPNPPIIQNQGAKTFVTTLAITAFDFANTGAAIASCAIDPALSVSGLNFNTSTCEISGTPTGLQASTLHTVTAAAADGSTDTATVTIAVNAANPPVLTDAGTRSWVTTVAVSHSFTNTGGNVTNCSTSSALPAGLTLDTNLNTCRISGIPSAAQAATNYTITATAEDGTTDSATINIAVAAANPPALADIEDPVELIKDEALTEEITFTNTGAAITSCSITPNLPNGLDFDENTCAISGTPTAASGSTLYTVTASAVDGSNDTATVTIKVEEDAENLICPAGYIPVPEYSDSDTGTVPAFCVMKYEAKNDGSNNAISQAAGTPWTWISQVDAVSRCQAISADDYTFDILTNAQWQSMARQIERYESAPGHYVNWSNNSTSGNNYLNIGYSTGGASIAASTDNDPCYGTGSPNCADHTHSDYLRKRIHTLPNGEIIWDLSGNLMEWMKEHSYASYGPDAHMAVVTTASHTAVGTLGTAKAVFGPHGNYSGKSTTPYGGLGYGVLNYTAGGLARGGAYPDHDYAGLFSSYTFLDSTSGTGDNIYGFRCVATPVAPTLGNVPPQTFVASANFNILPLTLTNTGSAVASCESSPALPAGLDVEVDTNASPASCRIVGRPSTPVVAANYVIKATDANNKTGSTTVNITVASDVTAPIVIEKSIQRAGGTLVVRVKASDDYGLYGLEVDHSLEGILPEFTAYASQSQPYGSDSDRIAFNNNGVHIIFDGSEWVIMISSPALNVIQNFGGISFFLIVRDFANNEWGSMTPPTSENTLTYTFN